jgi:hypothetical protein
MDRGAMTAKSEFPSSIESHGGANAGPVRQSPFLCPLIHPRSLDLYYSLIGLPAILFAGPSISVAEDD